MQKAAQVDNADLVKLNFNVIANRDTCMYLIYIRMEAEECVCEKRDEHPDLFVI